MDIYKNKYYKYKIKYLSLKNKQSGGNNFDETYTSKFTKRKDIFNYNEKEQCLKSVVYNQNFKTNYKYDKFVQLYYHAADYDDLKKYALNPIKKT